MSMIKKDAEYIIIQLWIMAMVMGIILRHVSEGLSNLLKWPLCAMGLMLMLYLILYYNIMIEHKIMILLVLISALINYLLIGMTTPYYLGYEFFVFIPIALALVYQKKFYLKLWVLEFMLVFLIVIGFWYKTSHFGYELFYSTSRNYISILLLFVLFFVSVACEKKNREIPIVVSIAYFMASLLGVGRGNVLAAGFYAMLYLIYIFFIKEFKTSKAKMIKKMIFFLGCIAALIAVIVLFEYLQNTILSRFNSEAGDNSSSIRMEMLTDYLKSLMDLPKLLFGSNSRVLSFELAAHDGNMHNSYFMLHAFFGSFTFMMMALGAFYSLIFSISRKKYMLTIILLCFLFRALTDFFFGGNIGDILLWYFVLYPFGEIRKEKYLNEVAAV